MWSHVCTSTAVYTPLSFHWTRWLDLCNSIGLLYVRYPLRPAPFCDPSQFLKGTAHRNEPYSTNKFKINPSSLTRKILLTVLFTAVHTKQTRNFVFSLV